MVAIPEAIWRGQPFLYQAIYKILNNQLYIGRISHKEKTYEGQHHAIISMELWEQVQALLKDGKEHRARRHAKHGALLMGKCFSQAGDLYTPTYTRKGGRQYRYYLQKSTGHRIKGPDLESLVIDAIRLLAREPKYWELCWKSCIKLIAKEAQHLTITELAKREGMGRTYISRVANLMYLAPEIISCILTGTQPTTMHLQDLIANLPVEWHRQKQLLKFSVAAD